MQINTHEYVVLNKKQSVIAVNQVLRKTYFLLSLTLFFSALIALATMARLLPYPGPVVTIVGMFGLMFLAQGLSKTKWGLFTVFAFTGFMGYALAPLLSTYLQQYNNGSMLIFTALGGTGAIFLSLSLYTIISRKDFSYMSGFIFAAISAAFLASIASIFLHIQILPVLVSRAY